MQPDPDSLEKLKQWTSQQQEHTDQSILDQIAVYDKVMGQEELVRNSADIELLQEIYDKNFSGREQERSDKAVEDAVLEIDRYFSDLEADRNRLLSEGYLRNREYRLPDLKR